MTKLFERSAFVAGALLIALIGYSVSAQTAPTVSGAQKFIVLTLTNGSTEIQSDSRDYEDRADTAEFDGDCLLLIVSKNGPVSLSGRNPNTFTIDWSKVTDIKRVDGSGSTPQYRLGGYPLTIIVTGEDLGTLFSYAANFLKDACDPAAGTGF